MEHIIGYLGSLLRQPSNPFQNLAVQTGRFATTNALVAMWPDFLPQKGDPRGSRDLGDGYLLLGPKDTSPYEVSHKEQDAINVFFPTYLDDNNRDAVYRWGHLKIPTEQIARSRFKELE